MMGISCDASMMFVWGWMGLNYVMVHDGELLSYLFPENCSIFEKRALRSRKGGVII